MTYFPVAMAPDGYRNAAEQQQPMNPYPATKQPPTTMYPGSTYSHSYYSESERQRNQDATPGQRPRMDYVQQQKTRQPINEVVHTAVDKANTSQALSPELLNQITSQVTATVLQHLKGTNPDSSAVNPTSNTAGPTPISAEGMARSSSIHSESSPPLPHRNVHTPPSPQRPSDEPIFVSPTSPTKSAAFSQDRQSPDHDRRPVSPGCHLGRFEEGRTDKAERPRHLNRQLTEITTLEKIWGTLFEGSRPTARLGQFLRGLALHLIEDYEPKHSLVITPAKMQKYYEDTKLASEVYAWQTVFDDRTSSISRLYREIEAQHHLVQERMDERPDIPALTPLGFERWSTLMLLAYPDQEFERLQKAVLDMPICNFDDRKERFPKEISRRLFPKSPDQAIRDKLEKAMVTHCNASILGRRTSGSEQGLQQPQSSAKAQRADSITSNTSAQPSASTHTRPENAPSSAAQGSGVERERQPYSTTPSEGAIEEEDDMPTPQPIERERKPYVVQPGVGRNYDDINRASTPPESRVAGPPPVVASTSSSKLGRSASSASNSGRSADPQRSQPIPLNPSQYSRQSTQPGMEGLSVPESMPSSRHRANSLLSHHLSGRATRHRSPSDHSNNNGDYRRVDVDTSVGPGSYVPYSASPSGDVMERHYPAERREPVRTSMYEMSSRGREGKPRYQSSTGYGDPSRGHYGSEEDYYRSTGGHNGYDGQKYYR